MSSGLRARCIARASAKSFGTDDRRDVHFHHFALGSTLLLAPTGHVEAMPADTPSNVKIAVQMQTMLGRHLASGLKQRLAAPREVPQKEPQLAVV